MGLFMTVCTCTSSTTSLTVADFEALSRNDFGGLALYFSDNSFSSDHEGIYVFLGGKKNIGIKHNFLSINICMVTDWIFVC